MLRLFIFIALCAWLAYVSRASLKNPRSHGFFRFFAWICITALILLNIERWFHDPSSPRQLVSWILLVASLVALVPGVHLLRTVGEPQTDGRTEDHLLGIEKTTRLVTTGAFGYVRHPLYASLLLLAWGAFLKDPSWVGLGLAAGATALLVATARAEEAENVRYFGTEYVDYMRRTKRFIPFLF